MTRDHSTSTPSEAEALFASFLERHHAGAADFDAFVSRYPEHADQLRRWWVQLESVGEVDSQGARRQQRRPQRDVAVALVDEVVHLLGDHVGGLADAGEDPEVLHQRRNDLLVPGGLDDLGEHGGEAAPTSRLRREDVTHPGARLERRHGSPGYRRATPATADVRGHPDRRRAAQLGGESCQLEPSQPQM